MPQYGRPQLHEPDPVEQLKVILTQLRQPKIAHIN
jgi:hypothetical protein